MWLELLQHIQSYLAEKNIAEKIYLGADVVTDTNFSGKGAIILSRGEEGKGDKGISRELTVSFYLETWVREDAADFCSGYEKLATLEAVVEESLTALRNEIGALNEDLCVFGNSWQLLDITAVEKRASADSYRPAYGTLYHMEAQIYCLDEHGGIW